MSELTCTICNLEFKSRSGLWKHMQKHNTNNIDIDKTYECKYCKKELSDRHSRWKHENKVCKKNPENNPETIHSIQQANTINNNSTIETQNNTNIQTQNNTQNNTINITFNKLGEEDLDILTQEEIEEIINNGLNSIIKLIEFINFNKAHPQNHTFCTTNLNNNYVSVMNADKNKIETHRKVDVYDKVLSYALRHIKLLRNKIIDKKKRKIFREKISELEQNIFGEIKYKKIVVEQLKSLSYDNRDIVEKTWADYFTNLFNKN